MTIRLRLTLWYTSILAVVLVAFGVFLYVFMDLSLREDTQTNLDRIAKEVNSEVKILGISTERGSVVIQLPDLDTFQYPGIYLQAINTENGNVTTSSNLNALIPVTEEQLVRIVKGEAFYDDLIVGDVSLLVYHWPMQFRGQVIGALQVASNISVQNASLDNLGWMLVLSGMVALILAATLGWFLARQSLQPIEFIRREADKIERGDDLNLRLEYSGPNDEIGRLTKTINGMFERLQNVYNDLQAVVQAQRRFVSDASHELRTPLTSIRGNVDFLQKMLNRSNIKVQFDEESEDVSLRQQMEDAIADMASESARMSRLVNDLLNLARADHGVELSLERIDLHHVIDELVRRVKWLPREAEWILGELHHEVPILVRGNSDYLMQMLNIFVENAFKYTPHGSVMMQINFSEERDRVGIQISDTGIGMEQEDIPHIFQRFYRADRSRGKTVGAGLGLPIAKWICDAHHGTIELFTEKGQGTTFIIWLPILIEEHIHRNEMLEQERLESNGSH